MRLALTIAYLISLFENWKSYLKNEMHRTLLQTIFIKYDEL